MAPQNSDKPTATRTRRRASAGIRRPKVAGPRPPRRTPDPLTTPTTPDAGDAQASPGDAWDAQASSDGARDARVARDGAHDAGASVGARDVRVSDEVTEAVPLGVEEQSAAARGRLRTLPLPAAPRTARGTALLAGATVVLVALAVLAGVGWWTMNHTAAAENTALVDVAATTQVSQQLGDAVKTVYSYDFARLDQNEAAARAVITPEFGQQFDQLFTEVRTLAPQQQAVVTATISQSAVESITGDRATLVVFLDQQATRAAGDQQQVAATGRLTVTGQLVDGQWKIADVVVA